MREGRTEDELDELDELLEGRVARDTDYDQTIRRAQIAALGGSVA